MKSKLLLFPLCALFACGQKTTTQIAENTFVYNSKIFRLIDNELTEVAELNSDSIRNLDVLKPKKKELGVVELNYVKPGAKAMVNALYRGNFLYYKIVITGLSDLKENYNPGTLTINFQDEFGFDLHSLEIPTSELTGIINENREVEYYVFKSKFETSTEINTAIKNVSISSSIKKSSFNY